MIPEIQNDLQDIVGNVPTLQHASGAGRIFELFVMTAIGRGLLNAGFSVWLQRSDGTIILPQDSDRRFIQRGGAPTGMLPASDGPNNASVIGFQWRKSLSWEIWNGIQFNGRSGTTHEIDIAIAPASVGDALRQTGGYPVGRPRVSIECKDVGAPGSVDETRSFVARLYDMTLLKAHHKYLPYGNPAALHPASPPGAAHRATVTYWQEKRRTRNLIARRTGFAAGTVALSYYHGVEQHAHVTAGSAAIDNLVTVIVDWAARHAK